MCVLNSSYQEGYLFKNSSFSETSNVSSLFFNILGGISQPAGLLVLNVGKKCSTTSVETVLYAHLVLLL